MKFFHSTLSLFVCLALMSCQTEIVVDELLDERTGFSCTIFITDQEMSISTRDTAEIHAGSFKHFRLIQFFHDNKKDWKSSRASYIGEVYVDQEDFQLIYSRGSDYVVIAYDDLEGDRRQYQKNIQKGELDFLFDFDKSSID